MWTVLWWPVSAAADPQPPVADGFDFPVGAPDAEGYIDTQPFGRNFHLGSDWNGVRGATADYGDPVTAAAAGVVRHAAHAGRGWGRVVVIAHRLPSGDIVETLYGHLAEMDVAVGKVVARGERVGTIGDADGRYIAHLHFELRTTPGLGVGPGYAQEAVGWTDPTVFIVAHRPVRRVRSVRRSLAGDHACVRH